MYEYSAGYIKQRDAKKYAEECAYLLGYRLCHNKRRLLPLLFQKVILAP